MTSRRQNLWCVAILSASTFVLPACGADNPGDKKEPTEDEGAVVANGVLGATPPNEVTGTGTSVHACKT